MSIGRNLMVLVNILVIGFVCYVAGWVSRDKGDGYYVLACTLPAISGLFSMLNDSST